jgi:pimeloyl-ACP methyl ester carboxylesterase
VPTRRTVPTPSGPVAALEAGSNTEATPVVLVPGYTGTKEDFALILGPLAAGGVRAVAIDLPGQFESPGPDDPAAYTVDALAGAVLGVVADLGGRAHLVGHSFGGLVCRAATIADPAAVLSLTLLDSGPAAIGGNRRERMEALEPLLAAGGMAGVYDALEFLAAGDPQWVAAPVEHREFLRRRFLAGTEAGLRGMGDALRAEPDRTAELRATGVPLLVAYGEADDAWPPAVQAQMAERLGAEHAVIAGAIHSPAAQQPAATVAVLLGFWAGPGGAASP